MFMKKHKVSEKKIRNLNRKGIYLLHTKAFISYVSSEIGSFNHFYDFFPIEKFNWHWFQKAFGQWLISGKGL